MSAAGFCVSWRFVFRRNRRIDRDRGKQVVGLRAADAVKRPDKAAAVFSVSAPEIFLFLARCDSLLPFITADIESGIVDRITAQELRNEGDAPAGRWYVGCCPRVKAVVQRDFDPVSGIGA